MKKMGNIIDKLYQIQIETEDFFVEGLKEANEREWELYAFLYERLKDDDKKAFLEYIKLKGERHNEELKISFQRGIQTTINLFIEGLNG